MENRKTVGISQAAALLGIHPNTLRKWADEGRVPFIKHPSGHRRFVVEELEGFRQAMTHEPEPEKLAAA